MPAFCRPISSRICTGLEMTSHPVNNHDRAGSQWRDDEALANFKILAGARPTSSAGLYGVVDAAIDPLLYPRLLAEPVTSQVTCLFDGQAASDYASVAPYLLVLHQESPLTHDWMRWGWRHHWGTWMATTQSPERIKRHLKKFLFVKQRNEKSYFRFYDPRVLQKVMEIFTDQQRGDFFGLNYRPMPHAWYCIVKKNHDQRDLNFSELRNEFQLRRYMPGKGFAAMVSGACRLQANDWPWNTSTDSL
jgi:hypothetical protein